jgi:hypothetical protein
MSLYFADVIVRYSDQKCNAKPTATTATAPVISERQ